MPTLRVNANPVLWLFSLVHLDFDLVECVEGLHLRACLAPAYGFHRFIWSGIRRGTNPCLHILWKSTLQKSTLIGTKRIRSITKILILAIKYKGLANLDNGNIIGDGSFVVSLVDLCLGDIPWDQFNAEK